MELPPGWSRIERPPGAFKRFHFEAYAQTRAFLEGLAALSERTGFYPDLGFGPRHVNVTLRQDADAAAAPDLGGFAAQVDALERARA